MKVNRIHAAVVAALTGASGLTYQTASAQEGLEEIVVTATRREQNLQEVPISIVAITGDNLETRGLDTLEDVGQTVPNLVITGGGGGTGGTNFRVRGIPNVGTYVDGVWQVGTAGFLTQEFVDIDRVEVLRGPQGTMFGRDSTGGALRIWTKRPAEEFGADVTATVGTLDRRDVKASLDLPLTDKLLTKWTGASLYRDGYIRSLQSGQNNGGVDQQVFRGDIVWMPTDRLDFRFNYSDNQSAFTEPRVQDAIFNTARDLGQLILISEFYGLAGAEPFTAQNLVAGFPGGRVGKWENRSDITRPNEYATRQSALNVNWDLSDSMNLQFTTAQTEQDADSYVDWDNSPYVLVNDYNRQRLEVFSQEIQLTGGGDRITWVGGLYYWDQKTINRNGRFSIEEFRNGRLNPQTALNSPGCQIPIPATPPPPRTTPRWLTCADVYAGHSPGGGSGPFDTLGIAETDGWAAFGEVTIGLSDTLDLSVGLRQHDQSGYSRTLSQIPGVTAPKPLTIYETHTNGDPFAGSIRNLTTGVENPRTPFQFDKLTSRLALQKQFNDDIMGYFSYSEGFNSGGVAVANIPTRPDPRVFFPFEPSTLKNYEFGMRSDWADGRVRFNATVFLTEWIDIQALGAVVNPDTGLQLPTLLTRNIGDAEAQGVEFELTLAPTDSILVNVNLGLLDTAYTQLPAGQTSGHLLWTEGTEFQQAPDTTYNLGFQHTASLGNGGTFVSRIDYSYQAQFWRSDPFLRISAYPSVPAGWSEESGDWGILNMRFTYEPSEGNWQAAVFGTNLTNEYQLNSGFFHGIWGYDFATVGRPREAGAALTFRF